MPAKPHVLVPRHRNVGRDRRAQVVLHRADLGPDDVAEGVATSRELTLLQCLRSLPEDEALAIADSALRAGEELAVQRALASAQGGGRSRVLRLGGAADGRAANPFESCLRAIALTVPGLRVVPQVEISSDHVWARPDLVDVERRIVVEAESFEFHADRSGFAKDIQRYTLLTAEGWAVLRFTWHEVMLRPAEVRAVLVRTVGGVDARTELTPWWPLAA